MSNPDMARSFVEGGGEKPGRREARRKPWWSTIAYKSSYAEESSVVKAFIKECFMVARPECWRCGRKPGKGWVLDLAHRVASGKGGADEPANLELACRHPATNRGCHPQEHGVPMFTKG